MAHTWLADLDFGALGAGTLVAEGLDFEAHAGEASEVDGLGAAPDAPC